MRRGELLQDTAIFIYAWSMPDSFRFADTQSALHLKGALHDVSKRFGKATTQAEAANHLQPGLSNSPDDLLVRSLTLGAADFNKLSPGDLVELKQPHGPTTFGLIKNKHRQKRVVELTPISARQATTIQHNFPQTHFMVLHTFSPAKDTKPRWLRWDFSPIEAILATFAEYFLTLMEKVVGKQLSQWELESKSLAVVIACLSLVSLIFWTLTLWRQF